MHAKNLTPVWQFFILMNWLVLQFEIDEIKIWHTRYEGSTEVTEWMIKKYISFLSSAWVFNCITLN